MSEPKQLHQYFYLLAAAVIVLLSWMWQRPVLVQSAVAVVSAEADNGEAEWQRIYGSLTIQPLPTQDCDPRGCGLIDFEHHPELIGGGVVLEPTN